MEVHAHTHTPRKKWTHYFWEFLMLFLAVFCGFLAENQREHMIEHQREKKYIASLVKDLELDIVSLRQAEDIRKKYANYYDSLIYLFKNYNDSSLTDIYFYARHAGRYTNFKYHDGTIQQLKSGGSLRLIRNKNAVDSIIIYDNELVNTVLDQQVFESTLKLKTTSDYWGKLFDAYEWNETADDTGAIMRTRHDPKLFNKDPKLINDFALHVGMIKTASFICNKYIEKAIHYAERLVVFLKKEYHLD
jgi:hypothetical protein